MAADNNDLLLVRVQDDMHGARMEGQRLVLNYARDGGYERNTLHFAVNSIVSDAPHGKFNVSADGELKGRVVIVADPRQMPAPAGWGQVDSWWRLRGQPGADGQLQRTLDVGEATIVAPKGTQVPQGAKVVFYEGGVEARNAAVQQVFAERGVPIHQGNFWGWEGTGQKQDEWRQETAAALWPANKQHIHLGPHSGSLDHELENATLRGMVQSMKDTGRLYDHPSGEQEPFVDVMERKAGAARDAVDRLLTTAAPPSEREAIAPHYEAQLQRIDAQLRDARALDTQMVADMQRQDAAQTPPPLSQVPPPLPPEPAPSATQQPATKEPPMAAVTTAPEKAEIFKPYTVVANNAPRQAFESADLAARAFMAAPLETMPKVEFRQRNGTIEIGGKLKPKTSTTTIAATKLSGSKLPVRKLSPSAPQEFTDALERAKTTQQPNQAPTQQAAPAPAQQAKPAAAPAVALPQEADTLYPQAVDVVKQQGKASIAAVQAELKVGYNRAARMVEQMERDGLVSPMASDGTRTLVQPQSSAQQQAPTTQTQAAAQQGNSIERARTPAPRYEGQPVGKVTFSKASAGGDQTYRVRVFGADGKAPLADVPQVAAADLAGRFGADVAQAITASKGRTGTLKFDAEAPQPQQAPAQQPTAQAPGAKPAPAAAAPAAAPAQATAPAQAPAPTQKPADAAAEALERRRQELVDSLRDRFSVKGSTYHFKGQADRKAFEDHGPRLSTDHDTAFVVRGMLDVAESKGWNTLKLNGTDDFKREAWLQASQRGIATRGYEPTVQDQQRLADLQQRQQGRNAVDAGPTPAPASRDKQKEQLLDVMKAAMRKDNVPADVQARVLKEASAEMAAMEARGESLPNVRLRDHRAPSQAHHQAMPKQNAVQQTHRVRH